jgi:hypothetical protein
MGTAKNNARNRDRVARCVLAAAFGLALLGASAVSAGAAPVSTNHLTRGDVIPPPVVLELQAVPTPGPSSLLRGRTGFLAE